MTSIAIYLASTEVPVVQARISGMWGELDANKPVNLKVKEISVVPLAVALNSACQ